MFPPVPNIFAIDYNYNLDGMSCILARRIYQRNIVCKRIRFQRHFRKEQGKHRKIEDISRQCNTKIFRGFRS